MHLTRSLPALLATGALSTGGVAIAQPPQPAGPAEDTLFFLPNLPPVPAFGGRIDVVRSEGDVPGRVVAGKPYSARSITESTQTLADGNRIVQRNEALVYRDSAGRTRREQTLMGFGAWQAGEPVTMINVFDPVAGKTFVLDPAARTARELRPFRMAIAAAGAVEAPPAGEPPPGPQNVTMLRHFAAGGGSVQVFAGAAPFEVAIEAAAGAEPEDLGEQVLEGLLVSGTRLVAAIPAGALGNERPIEIVTERWYSEDIDAIVLHRHSDPRFGETIYRLVNVVRGDPSPDLFEIPQGYEVLTEEPPRLGLRAIPGAPGRRFDWQFEPAAPANPSRD